MKYKKEINIFSTSPADIKEEHNIISSVCDALNKNTLLNPYGISFHDTGWKDVFPAPGNPQDIIHKLLDECDIFVCIFHKRFESFSGNSESLALKEFLIVYDKWKSCKKPYIMFYFKRVEVNSLHELTDPQLMKVFDLKEKINREAMLIFGEFTHSEDFRERFLRDIKNWIVQNTEYLNPFEKKKPDRTLCKIQNVPASYKKWISDHCNYLDLNELREKGNVIQVKLSEVFIPLYTYASVKQSENVELVSQRNSDLKEKENLIEIERLVSRGRYLLIEGNPGSGKSAFFKYLSYKLMQKSDISGLENLIPILIYLKDLKGFFNNRELKSKASTVESILKYYFDDTENGLDLETALAFCEANSVIFLIDGLDEINHECREIIVKSFADFMTKYEGNKLVLSGRPHSMEGAVIDRFGEWHVTIQSLNMEQVESIIKKWFKYIGDQCTKIGLKTAQDMISEINSFPEIQQLIDSPLMLTAICILYYEGKELPGQRTELYNKFIKNLLQRRFTKPEKIYDFFKTLAFQMYSNEISSADRVFATNILRTLYKIRSEETEKDYKQRIEREFDRLQNDCGILKFDNGQYIFLHLSFYKFLTAAYMVDEMIDQAEITTNYFDNDHYKGIIELFIGYLSIFNKGFANQIVGDVINAEDNDPYRRWLLASKSLIDIQYDRRQNNVLDMARKRMLSIIDDGVKPEIIVEAGEVLGWIGDSRELDEFIPIAGGTYTLNLNVVTLDRFEIGKYPVTNKWYKEFIKDGGYDNRDYWSDEGRKWLDYTKATQPALWNHRKWKCPNSPVVGVSWYESYAFTRWLTIERNDGYEYRLLDENEWEAIASGGCWEKGRNYPWGDVWDKNSCNNSEIKINKPSPVGIFKNGETIDGISDLCGNVWEWTSSDFHSKKNVSDFLFNEDVLEIFNNGEIGEYVSKSEKETNLPVLRGGSYLVERDLSSCSFRSWFYPYIRYEDIGFRCARTRKS